LVFYLDRNLGRATIADILRAAGFEVEVHDDHLPQDAPDEDWIQLVAQNQWIGVTKDKNIRYRRSEIAAIKYYQAKVIVVRMKDLTGEQMGQLIAKNGQKILEFISRHSAPVIAGVDRNGKLQKYDI